MTCVDIAPLFRITLILLILAPTMTVAQSVVRVSGGQNGHGVAVLRDGVCFVLSPSHVIGDDDKNAFVLTPAHGNVALELVRTEKVVLTLTDDKGVEKEEHEDLTLLRTTGNPAAVCSDNLRAFTNERRSYAVTNDGKDEIKLHELSLLSVPNDIFTFEFTRVDPAQMQTMSGAPVIWGGKLVGMVVQLSTSPEVPIQYAYGIELIARRFGQWVTGAQVDIPKVDQALSILEHVRKLLPAADIGQVAALREIQRGKVSLAGVNMPGFFLDGARLDDIDLTGSDLSVATLNNAILLKAILRNARLNYVIAQNIALPNADLTASHHNYANYDGAIFNGANFTRAKLVYATLRGAKLRQAKLIGTNLTYSDLSGADLTNADLTDALLNGANLEGVIGLDTATFHNTSITNMVGANGRKFTDEQVCGYPIYQGGFDHFEVIRRTPSARFDSGFVHDDLLDYTEIDSWSNTPATIIGMDHYNYLAPCKSSRQETRPVGTDFPSSNQPGWNSLSVRDKYFFEREFLEKRGIQKYIRRRMVERFKDVIKIHLKGRLVFPTTDRDASLTAHISGLKTSIGERRPWCVESNQQMLNHLRELSGSVSHESNDIESEFVEALRSSLFKAEALRFYREQHPELSVDVSLIWPFGALHPADTPVGGGLLHLPIPVGVRSAAAYLQWRQKVWSFAQLAICIPPPRMTGADFLVGSSFVTDYSENSLSVSVARAAIARETVQPDLVMGVAGAKSTFLLALYFDRLPPEYDKNDSSLYNTLSESLQPTEQLHWYIEFENVELRAKDELMVARVRFLDAKRVPFVTGVD